MYQDEWRSVTTIHDLLFRDFFLCRRVGDPFSPAGPLPSPSPPLARPSVTLFGALARSLRPLSLSFSSHRIRSGERDGRVKRERERKREERARKGGGRQCRTIREVKPLLPKRIMRGKIKFFSTRPFELHRPRDHALLLLVLYTVYTFRGMRPLPPSPTRPPTLPFSLPPFLRPRSLSLILPPRSLDTLRLLVVTLFADDLRAIESPRESLHLRTGLEKRARVAHITRVYVNIVGHSERFSSSRFERARRRRCRRVW